MIGELKTFAQQCIYYRLQCKQTAKHQDPKEQISACLSPFTTNHICLSLLKIRPQQTVLNSPPSSSPCRQSLFFIHCFLATQNLSSHDLHSRLISQSKHLVTIFMIMKLSDRSCQTSDCLEILNPRTVQLFYSFYILTNWRLVTAKQDILAQSHFIMGYYKKPSYTLLLS